mgnify:CR=1 FL=1
MTGGAQGAGDAGGGGGGFDWAGALGEGGKDFLPVVQTKGWKGPADAVKSYTELEKTLGADRIVLPGKDAKPEEWDAVYGKLGRPGKPEEYGFKPPAGIPEGIYDPKFASWAQTAFHKAGLTARQAAAVHDEFVKMSLEGHNARVNDIKAKGDAGEAELRKEWGGDYDKHVEAGRRAAKALGVEAADLDRIESAIGMPKLLKLFAQIGGRMGEDSAVGSGAGGLRDPSAELNDLNLRRAERMKADPTWAASPEAQQLERRRMELYAQLHPGMAS